jgi:hypothetical protein
MRPPETARPRRARPSYSAGAESPHAFLGGVGARRRSVGGRGVAGLLGGRQLAAGVVQVRAASAACGDRRARVAFRGQLPARGVAPSFGSLPRLMQGRVLLLRGGELDDDLVVGGRRVGEGAGDSAVQQPIQGASVLAEHGHHRLQRCGLTAHVP